MLHLDLDVYQPTMSALENFYDKISSGGVILIDDYGQVEGATSATNKFLKIRSIKSKIKTLKFDKRLIFILKK